MEACATWAVEALISSEGAASANAWLERPGLLPTLAGQMQSCNMELLRTACFTYSKLAIQVRCLTVQVQSCSTGLLPATSSAYSKLATQVRFLAVQMQSCNTGLLWATCSAYSKLAIQGRRLPAFLMAAHR